MNSSVKTLDQVFFYLYLHSNSIFFKKQTFVPLYIKKSFDFPLLDLKTIADLGGSIVPCPPWRSLIREIRDRFKVKTFQRSPGFWEEKSTKPRQIQIEDLFLLLEKIFRKAYLIVIVSPSSLSKILGRLRPACY